MPEVIAAPLTITDKHYDTNWVISVDKWDSYRSIGYQKKLDVPALEDAIIVAGGGGFDGSYNNIDSSFNTQGDASSNFYSPNYPPTNAFNNDISYAGGNYFKAQTDAYQNGTIVTDSDASAIKLDFLFPHPRTVTEYRIYPPYQENNYDASYMPNRWCIYGSNNETIDTSISSTEANGYVLLDSRADVKPWNAHDSSLAAVDGSDYQYRIANPGFYRQYRMSILQNSGDSSGNIIIGELVYREGGIGPLVGGGALDGRSDLSGGLALHGDVSGSFFQDASPYTIAVDVSSDRFTLDGDLQPTLNLHRGSTYKFDQSDIDNSGQRLFVSNDVSGRKVVSTDTILYDLDQQFVNGSNYSSSASVTPPNITVDWSKDWNIKTSFEVYDYLSSNMYPRLWDYVSADNHGTNRTRIEFIVYLRNNPYVNNGGSTSTHGIGIYIRDPAPFANANTSNNTGSSSLISEVPGTGGLPTEGVRYNLILSYDYDAATIKMAYQEYDDFLSWDNVLSSGTQVVNISNIVYDGTITYHSTYSRIGGDSNGSYAFSGTIYSHVFTQGGVSSSSLGLSENTVGFTSTGTLGTNLISTWTIPLDASSTMYYASDGSANAGGLINITDKPAYKSAAGTFDNYDLSGGKEFAIKFELPSKSKILKYDINNTNVKSWTLRGCDNSGSYDRTDSTTYEVLDSKTTSNDSTGSSNNVVSNPKDYTYYVLDVTSSHDISYAEVGKIIYYNTGTYPCAGAGGLDGSSGAIGGLQLHGDVSGVGGITSPLHTLNGTMIDSSDSFISDSGIFSNNQLVNGKEFSLKFEFPTKKYITTYRIWSQTGGSMNAPSAWYLYGCDSSSAYARTDENTYRVLDVRTSENTWPASSTSSISDLSGYNEYNIIDPGSYSYYVLDISSSNNAVLCSIGQISYYESERVDVTTSRDPQSYEIHQLSINKGASEETSDWEIGEIIVFNKKLSATEERRIVSHLENIYYGVDGFDPAGNNDTLHLPRNNLTLPEVYSMMDPSGRNIEYFNEAEYNSIVDLSINMEDISHAQVKASDLRNRLLNTDASFTTITGKSIVYTSSHVVKMSDFRGAT